MSLRFVAFFVTGFLGGVVACWARIQCLRARRQLMEFFLRQHLDAHLEELARPCGKLGNVPPAKAA